MSEWQDISTAERPDEDTEPVIVLDRQGRRFIAEWDGCAGHWQGIYAVDGVERENFYQEFPGRLHGVVAWHPIPKP